MRDAARRANAKARSRRVSGGRRSDDPAGAGSNCLRRRSQMGQPIINGEPWMLIELSLPPTKRQRKKSPLTLCFPKRASLTSLLFQQPASLQRIQPTTLNLYS